MYRKQWRRDSKLEVHERGAEWDSVSEKTNTHRMTQKLTPTYTIAVAQISILAGAKSCNAASLQVEGDGRPWKTARQNEILPRHPAFTLKREQE
jgi:hypothetical protein